MGMLICDIICTVTLISPKLTNVLYFNLTDHCSTNFTLTDQMYQI